MLTLSHSLSLCLPRSRDHDRRESHKRAGMYTPSHQCGPATAASRAFPGSSCCNHSVGLHRENVRDSCHEITMVWSCVHNFRWTSPPRRKAGERMSCKHCFRQIIEASYPCVDKHAHVKLLGIADESRMIVLLDEKSERYRKQGGWCGRYTMLRWMVQENKAMDLMSHYNHITTTYAINERH